MLVVWTDWALPWFECPRCGRRCRHIFLELDRDKFLKRTLAMELVELDELQQAFRDKALEDQDVAAGVASDQGCGKAGDIAWPERDASAVPGYSRTDADQHRAFVATVRRGGHRPAMQSSLQRLTCKGRPKRGTAAFRRRLVSVCGLYRGKRCPRSPSRQIYNDQKFERMCEAARAVSD